MTRASKRALALQARQYGYFTRGHDSVANAERLQVRCPQCGEWVDGWLSRYGAENTAAKALDRGMLDHLSDNCGGAR